MKRLLLPLLIPALREGAEYPGKLDDETQWADAARLTGAPLVEARWAGRNSPFGFCRPGRKTGASSQLGAAFEKAQSGSRLRGDLGVLRGIGGQTLQRVYWTNKATAIVADVPSEAQLTPKLWGTFELTAP